MATASKSKSSSKSSSKPSTRTTAAAKSASGSTGTDTVAKQAAKDAEAIHKMRSEYTNPPVDTPVDVTETLGEVQTVGKAAALKIVAVGGGAEVSIGNSKVLLDREGVLAAQRHFVRIGGEV